MTFSVWAKDRTGVEEALRVELSDEADIFSLKLAINALRTILHLPVAVVQHISSKNDDDPINRLKPSVKISKPTQQEIGSSEDYPYYFYLSQYQSGKSSLNQSD